MPIREFKHWWNPFGVPQFCRQEEGRKWRYKRQAWRDRFTVDNPYGDPDMENEEFLEFVSTNRVSKNEMPTAARVINEDRAVHLALTYNNWMYRSTKQKRAQLEDAIYWGYVSALRQTLHQCLVKEGQGEGMRFCRPIYRAYLDAMAPITNIQHLWEEEDIEQLKKKRLQIYEKWNRQRQEMWDKHGFDLIEQEHDQQY